jgi:LemA protein
MQKIPQIKPVWIIIGVLLLFILWIGGTYNSLIRAKIVVDTSWAQVENNYQTRFDLVPNLQSIVQGAANFEQETLTAVTEARTQWQSATTRDEQVAAGSSFDSALSRLLVTVEAYPQLTATEGFRTFQAQLEGVENRIRVARMDYNNSVGTYNTFIVTFPRNVVANLFGFNPEPFFQATQGAEQAPQIDFS